MGNNFIEDIRAKAKAKNLKVAFPDAEDARSIEASQILLKERIAKPVLVGNKDNIEKVAKEHDLTLDGIEIADPDKSELKDEFADQLYKKRKHKGMTPEEAMNNILDPLYFAGFMLENDKVSAAVGGNVSSTGNVLKAAIYSVGVAEGISIVSSFFIMVFPEKLYCFADCAVNPDPNDNQLADIAISSAKNFESITSEKPKVAMLSFSTKGSAKHEHVDKVIAATNNVKEKAPDLQIDGELQLDAAILPKIGERKAPDSKVAGHANVLIFPDLDAGNIGYKLTQRLAGAEAVGPIVQGLKKPYCDLSRGCSTDDMVNVAAICTLMA